MKLSDYAKKLGICYMTAFRYWKAGKLDGFTTSTGTIIITEKIPNIQQIQEVKIALYARVSSSENKSNLKTQIQRLENYAAAKGYKVSKEVSEIGSGINDNRKKLMSLLSDKSITTIIVEHKDRLTRFGFNYIKTLLENEGRNIEVINEVDNDKQDLIQDFISIITSFCARIYGLRRSKRKTEELIKKLENEKT